MAPNASATAVSTTANAAGDVVLPSLVPDMVCVRDWIASFNAHGEASVPVIGAVHMTQNVGQGAPALSDHAAEVSALYAGRQTRGGPDG